MRRLLVLAQLAGAVAVLAGIALLLPLGGALVADGLVVLALATAFEVALRRAQDAPQDRRSREETGGPA